MYLVHIPVIAQKEIEIIEKSRAESINKAFYLIENNMVDINWKLVKDVSDSIRTSSIIPGKLYINEDDLECDKKRYLISIPCTGYASIYVDAKNEREAINIAMNLLRNAQFNVFDIKVHDELSFDNTSILIKAEVKEIY